MYQIITSHILILHSATCQLYLKAGIKTTINASGIQGMCSKFCKELRSQPSFRDFPSTFGISGTIPFINHLKPLPSALIFKFHNTFPRETCMFFLLKTIHIYTSRLGAWITSHTEVHLCPSPQPLLLRASLNTLQGINFYKTWSQIAPFKKVIQHITFKIIFKPKTAA